MIWQLGLTTRWWGMNFNLWTIHCWHWVGYSSVRCSMIEDAPSVAKGRVMPQDQVNNIWAQRHHSKPEPCSDPVAQAVANKQQLRAHTLLQFPLVSAFFLCQANISSHLKTSELINHVRVSWVMYSGNSEGHALSPSPRCFHSFPQQGKFGSGTHCHSTAKVRR